MGFLLGAVASWVELIFIWGLILLGLTNSLWERAGFVRLGGGENSF